MNGSDIFVASLLGCVAGRLDAQPGSILLLTTEIRVRPAKHLGRAEPRSRGQLGGCSVKLAFAEPDFFTENVEDGGALLVKFLRGGVRLGQLRFRRVAPLVADSSKNRPV